MYSQGIWRYVIKNGDECEYIGSLECKGKSFEC